MPVSILGFKLFKVKIVPPFLDLSLEPTTKWTLNTCWVKEGREQSFWVVGPKIRIEGKEKWELDKKGNQKDFKKWLYSICAWRKSYCHWCRGWFRERRIRIEGGREPLLLCFWACLKVVIEQKVYWRQIKVQWNKPSENHQKKKIRAKCYENVMTVWTEDISICFSVEIP